MTLIIIADPDEYTRAQIKIQLENLNVEVITLENGLEVWETLQKISPIIPDCVITEIVMPKMNGYELIRRAGNNLSLHPVNWIFYTYKDQNFDHFWASKGSILSAYVNKTDSKVSRICNNKFSYFVGDDALQEIQVLITEFHANEDPELKYQISRRLIDYSLPNLIKVVKNFIYTDEKN
ncbi:response regulator [Anabaena azotica]|uniref:response regulator n=1 Tax=Anabaena azotica TaxID=197653 RepID=UPI0039A5F895